ncbi:MAG: amidohydrolase [Bacillota bacterium]
MKVIINAMLYTMDSINGEIGYVAINNGKIEAVGTDFNQADFKGYDIIDAKQHIVTPGIVDPHCHIGIFEEGIKFEGDDTNEMTNPIYPELRGLDSVYPHDRAFKYAAPSGVTSVVTGPGSANVIGGTFTALKTVGNTVDDMVFKDEVCIKMALGENPKRVYSGQKKAPSTRMASAALMREWLMKAKQYHEAYQAYENGEEDAKKPTFDMKLHSLMRVFDGMLVKIHAHRSDDIMTAIRISKEFGLNVTIDHATEAYLIPEAIKASGVNVIIGPTLGYASKYELIHKSFESAKVLEDHEIPFAIMTDHPIVTVDVTMVQVAMFMKEGLSRDTALKAVTINAAKLNGIEDRVGSLEPGKDADIVIWDNDPFDIMTRTKLVMIDGRIVHEV